MLSMEIQGLVESLTGIKAYPNEFPQGISTDSVIFFINKYDKVSKTGDVSLSLQFDIRTVTPSEGERIANVLISGLDGKTGLLTTTYNITYITADALTPYFVGRDGGRNYINTIGFNVLLNKI